MRRQERLGKCRFFQLNHVDSVLLLLTRNSSVHNCFVDTAAHEAGGEQKSEQIFTIK